MGEGRLVARARRTALWGILGAVALAGCGQDVEDAAGAAEPSRSPDRSVQLPAAPQDEPLTELNTKSWRCDYTNPDGFACIRTFTPSGVTGGNYVSAVDVFGMKDTPGCESARFYHQILNANMTVRATWWDSGAFNLCSGKNKSFLWHHAGKGAFVPNHGFVVGYLVVGKRTYRTAYIPQAEL